MDDEYDSEDEDNEDTTQHGGRQNKESAIGAVSKVDVSR